MKPIPQMTNDELLEEYAGEVATLAADQSSQEKELKAEILRRMKPSPQRPFKGVRLTQD